MFLLGKLKAYAAAVLIGMIALASIWFGGRKAGKTAAKISKLEAYREARKRMDEIGRMSDADAARDWLRERGK